MPVEDARIGTWDGLDNRKWLMEQLEALGHGLGERAAGMKRARFVRSLLDDAEPDWKGKPMRVDPCASVEAYHLLVALMSGFGVPMETIARRLEAEVRRR